MKDSVKRVALSVLLGLLVNVPAKAQSVDDLKAMVLKLQQRVDQLEKARPVPARREPAPQGPTATQIQAAKQASDKAQQSAVEAKQAAAQAEQDATRAKDTAGRDQGCPCATAGQTGWKLPHFRHRDSRSGLRLRETERHRGLDHPVSERLDHPTVDTVLRHRRAATGWGLPNERAAVALDVETWTPVNDAFGELHSLMEIDFAGQNTSLTTQSTSSSYTPRLRKFYGDFGKPVGGWGALLLGQETSVFNDNWLLPSSG